MNNRQKLGYMALGAAILAIGITIGQFIIPNIEAQNNGVFDEITCRRLEVVDEAGKTAVLLESEGNWNHVKVYDKAGNKSIQMNASERDRNITLFNKIGSRAIQLGVIENPYIGLQKKQNNILVYDKVGNISVELFVNEGGNSILVYDKVGNISVGLSVNEDDNNILVYDKAGDVAVQIAGGIGGGISQNNILLKSNVGQEGIALVAQKKGAPYIQIYDRAGNVRWNSGFMFR